MISTGGRERPSHQQEGSPRRPQEAYVFPTESFQQLVDSVNHLLTPEDIRKIHSVRFPEERATTLLNFLYWKSTEQKRAQEPNPDRLQQIETATQQVDDWINDNIPGWDSRVGLRK